VVVAENEGDEKCIRGGNTHEPKIPVFNDIPPATCIPIITRPMAAASGKME